MPPWTPFFLLTIASQPLASRLLTSLMQRNVPGSQNLLRVHSIVDPNSLPEVYSGPIPEPDQNIRRKSTGSLARRKTLPRTATPTNPVSTVLHIMAEVSRQFISVLLFSFSSVLETVLATQAASLVFIAPLISMTLIQGSSYMCGEPCYWTAGTGVLVAGFVANWL